MAENDRWRHILLCKLTDLINYSNHIILWNDINNPYSGALSASFKRKQKKLQQNEHIYILEIQPTDHKYIFQCKFDFQHFPINLI